LPARGGRSEITTAATTMTDQARNTRRAGGERPVVALGLAV
jgi:hypothetical protein